MKKELERFIKVGEGRKELLAAKMRVSVETVRRWSTGDARMSYADEEILKVKMAEIIAEEGVTK